MAIAVVSLVKITFIKFHILDGDLYMYFSFVGTIVGYNFVKYANVSRLYHRRLTKSMTTINVLTGICLVVCVYLGYMFSLKAILYLLPFIFLTILYVIPVFPKKKNLRSIAGVKIFIIGITWMGLTVLLPFIYAEESIHYDIIIECVQRFLFVVVLMLPFEIRDLQYDSKELVTIPQKMGVTRTKVFGSIILGLFLVLTICKDALSFVEILGTVLITILSLLFLWATRKKQSVYFCSFWVESIPIMWLLILILIQTLFK